MMGHVLKLCEIFVFTIKSQNMQKKACIYGLVFSISADEPGTLIGFSNPYINPITFDYMLVS